MLLWDYDASPAAQIKVGACYINRLLTFNNAGHDYQVSAGVRWLSHDFKSGLAAVVELNLAELRTHKRKLWTRCFIMHPEFAAAVES
jgi:hypothetical protein